MQKRFQVKCIQDKLQVRKGHKLRLKTHIQASIKPTEPAYSVCISTDKETKKQAQVEIQK